MQRQPTKRTFYQFLRYYLLIALLPLFVIVIIFCYESFGRTRQYFIDSQKAITINGISTLESHLSIIQGYPQQLAKSTVVSDFRRSPDTMNRLALIRELNRVVGGNALISNLLVYFRESEILVSAYSNSWSKEDILNSLVLRYAHRHPEEILNLVSHLKASQVLPEEPVQIGPLEGTRETVSFLSSLPVNNRFAYATVMIMVDAPSLRTLLRADAGDAFFLMDIQGSVVLSEGLGTLSAADLLEHLEDAASGVREISMDGTRMILSWGYSPSYGYTLVRLASIQPVINQQLRLMNLVLLAMAGLSILILLLTAVFMRRTYTPIRDLVQMTGSGKESEAGEKGNAFTVIGDAIASLQAENTRLATDIDRRNPLLAEYSARIMLSTPEDNWNGEVYDAGVMAGLPMGFDRYKVMVLEYPDGDLLSSAAKSVPSLLSDQLVISFTEALRTRLIVLLGCSKESRIRDKWIEEALPLAAGIGPSVDSVKQWNASYIRASLACDCASDAGSGKKIMRFDEIPSDFYTPSYPWESLQTLNAAINQVNPETVRTSGQRICTYITRHFNASPETIRTVYQQALQMFAATRAEVVQEEMNTLRLHPEKAGSEAMTEVLTGLIEAFCREAEDTTRDRMNSPVYRSLQIISEELGSEDLSLIYVAERVGLSPSRYSTMFRLEMNRNFKEYVDELRLEHAKHLLKNTDLQINLIGQKVGYLNAYSFNRFFKGKTGMTPGEYRNREE